MSIIEFEIVKSLDSFKNLVKGELFVYAKDYKRLSTEAPCYAKLSRHQALVIGSGIVSHVLPETKVYHLSRPTEN